MCCIHSVVRPNFPSIERYAYLVYVFECFYLLPDVLLRVLLIVQRLLQENKHLSKRDIYYMHPSIFSGNSVICWASMSNCCESSEIYQLNTFTSHLFYRWNLSPSEVALKIWLHFCQCHIRVQILIDENHISIYFLLHLFFRTCTLCSNERNIFIRTC